MGRDQGQWMTCIKAKLFSFFFHSAYVQPLRNTDHKSWEKRLQKELGTIFGPSVKRILGIVSNFTISNFFLLTPSYFFIYTTQLKKKTDDIISERQRRMSQSSSQENFQVRFIFFSITFLFCRPYASFLLKLVGAGVDATKNNLIICHDKYSFTVM